VRRIEQEAGLPIYEGLENGERDRPLCSDFVDSITLRAGCNLTGSPEAVCAFLWPTHHLLSRAIPLPALNASLFSARTERAEDPLRSASQHAVELIMAMRRKSCPAAYDAAQTSPRVGIMVRSFAVGRGAK
jgi:hypothetical protein